MADSWSGGVEPATKEKPRRQHCREPGCQLFDGHKDQHTAVGLSVLDGVRRPKVFKW